MKITTAAFAGPQDVYVAGSFHTQVWNGDRHEFVKIFNIAHFNAVEQVWLPINVGQITCSWCTVTVLALAWDSKRNQLHVAGKFNAIDGRNVPAGLAIYDHSSGHLVAHPGGGLSMRNSTQDGVGTALQFDEESGVLYVMGSFERLTATYEICLGLAAYEIQANRWTCLANAAHTVLPTGGGNMLLTPYGLMLAGQTTSSTTWPNDSKPYTIALLTTTLRKKKTNVTLKKTDNDDEIVVFSQNDTVRAFDWSWLPGFDGHDEPLHALSNGFGEYEGSVFIAGDNFVAMWSYPTGGPVGAGGGGAGTSSSRSYGSSTSTSTSSFTQPKPYTEVLSNGHIVGAIMAISQMAVHASHDGTSGTSGSKVNPTVIVYWVALGTMIGMFIAVACNRKVTSTIVSVFSKDGQLQGIPLDTLSYSAIDDSNLMEAYQRAMRTRYVNQPNLLTLINPQEIFLQRIIGEGSFGKVWSAKWGTSTVAVKEFVFAQAAVAGKSMMQQEIIDSIVGEAGMMAILRHPNVLQLFGCSLTAQAIWIVSELCSLGSLRQLLDDHERNLSTHLRLSLALQVAEGIAYLHNQDPPIIHRDLKSHNIFVHETFTSHSFTGSESSSRKLTSNSTSKRGDKKNAQETREEDNASPRATIIAKIGDWGSARASLSRGERTMTHGVGTACWMAPETIKKGRSSKYSDVYSYGIILWEMWTRKEVYDGLGPAQIIHQVANENLRPVVPEDCPWKDLMVRCWQQIPKDRPDFDQIVEELNKILEDIPNDEFSVPKKLAASAKDKSQDET
jgi:serine/threonine protein kinase